jgi:tetratricopeptide (TPR) repeat protein
MGDNAAMINYVNFSMAICEYQIYKQNNQENMHQYLSMIHEIAQLFLRERNEPMLKILVDKGRNLLEVAENDEKVTDLVCSMLTLQANLYFSTGRHEDALANYTEVVERRDNYKNSLDVSKRVVIAADYARRASSYTELDRLAEAQEGYEEAINILNGIKGHENDEKICGELASAYMNYSVCLGKQGKIEEAHNFITKAYELVEGKKLTQQGLMVMRRRIRKMKSLTETENAVQMYDPKLMEDAKKEIGRLNDANKKVQNNEFEAAAEEIESALNNLREMGVVDIVLPSEAYAANLAACASLHQDKLNNEIKAMSMLKAAWTVVLDLANDGLRVNPQFEKNLRERLKIK